MYFAGDNLTSILNNKTIHLKELRDAKKEQKEREAVGIKRKRTKHVDRTGET